MSKQLKVIGNSLAIVSEPELDEILEKTEFTQPLIVGATEIASYCPVYKQKEKEYFDYGLLVEVPLEVYKGLYNGYGEKVKLFLIR